MDKLNRLHKLALDYIKNNSIEDDNFIEALFVGLEEDYSELKSQCLLLDNQKKQNNKAIDLILDASSYDDWINYSDETIVI